MSRFEQVRVQGFRRLQDLEMGLRPLCVLIGANGSGKTSLLDVFALLAASASGGLNAKIGEFGGLPAILTRSRTQQMALELSMDVPNHNPLVYKVVLNPSGVAYEI